MTSESLWNFYKDEVNDDTNVNSAAGSYRINNNKITTSKSFEYKAKIRGSIPADNSGLDTEIVVPLKYLSKLCRFLDLPFINCEVELDLRCGKNYVISEI